MTDGKGHMDSTDTNVTSRRRRWIALAVAATVIALLGGWYTLARDTNTPDPMTNRAAQVMPFDLSRTTHTFTKTDVGGVEKVVVNDPTDTHDLSLIRSHLAKEATRFRSGDYSDPAKIHGMDMPGLKELEAGVSRVNVTYTDLPDGAQITYSSDEPALVSAIHSWFDRQVADHAMPGMGG